MKGVIVRPSTFYVYFYLELVLDRVENLTGGVVPGFPEMSSCCPRAGMIVYNNTVGQCGLLLFLSCMAGSSI